MYVDKPTIVASIRARSLPIDTTQFDSKWYDLYVYHFLCIFLCRSHRQHHPLSDFCDGQVYQSHPLFSVHSTALQIFFYFDDLEVCNPLGSKAKIHKISKGFVIITHLNSFKIEFLLIPYILEALLSVLSSLQCCSWDTESRSSKSASVN